MSSTAPNGATLERPAASLPDDGHYARNLIGGRWLFPAAPYEFEIRHPGDSTITAVVPLSSRFDVDRAFGAATAALRGPWAGSAERILMLQALIDRVEASRTELARLQSTETGLWFGIDDLTKRKIHVDRIVLLSDLCCYTQGDVNCGVNMSQYFGRGATVQSMIDRYRQAVNPNCYVYSINLNGHSQSQVRPNDERTFLLSGWSEKLVNLIVELESPQQIPNAGVPVMEALRSKYGRSG